jgi:Tfp pilus assembly pilus retraction ATPase PilT
MSAANSFDKIEIEYTKHQLKIISNGITERIGALKTEILLIENNGDTKYTITEKGYPQPDIRSNIDEKKLNKIKALIKETGFIAISPNSFSIFENVTDYQKSSVKITLNGQVNQIHWPETNATPDFIPPIITMVESELDKIMSEISE